MPIINNIFAIDEIIAIINNIIKSFDSNNSNETNIFNNKIQQIIQLIDDILYD
jgi:hypothetical protein